MSANDQEMEMRVSEPVSNVFDALGIEDSVEVLAKAQIVHTISSIIRHRHLKQDEAAKVLGIAQPKVSGLMNGHLGGWSIEKLIELMNKLDRDVEIRITKKPRTRDSAYFKVKVA